MSSNEESAVASYGGYEYQLVVTVWVALDLLIERGYCDAIEIEPASQEDIALDLHVPPASADRVETTIGVPSTDGPVEIQIKRRSRFWSVADFRALLETPLKHGTRGPAPRERALSRLVVDKQLRYVLVTDAEVHPDLKKFVVDHVGGTSRATDTSLRMLPAGVATRIGVREKQVLDLVEHEIRYLLEQSARVPFQKVPACRDALVERVRERLLGRRGARLSRSELEELIGQHGGFPPSTSQDFVPPARFDELRRRLDEAPFALVLIGPPGIGKTWVAERLALLHTQADRPFEIVQNPSPHEIRVKLRRPGRTLFYLEDPWGRYKLAEDAGTWTDELPRLIRAATPDKRFLVTSRTGLLRESIDFSPQGRSSEQLERKIGAFVASIVEDDFDAAARRRILTLSMRGAQRWQRDWIEDRLGEIVPRLTMPHALSTFANFVKSAQHAKELSLEKLIASSHVAAIGDVVKQQVRELDEVSAGVTLWAFLSVGEPLTASIVDKLALWVAEAPQLAADLPRLCEHLISNGWLASRDGVLTAHPTVIEGLERMVNEARPKSTVALRMLLALLVQHGRVKLATRLLHGLSGRNLPVPPEVHAAIDQYLRDAVLAAEGTQLVSAMTSVARLSRGNDPVTLLARALGTRKKTHGFEKWSRPKWTAEERAAVGASSDAERTARRYIRGRFGSPIWIGAERVADFLWSIGWDLSEDFRAAAVEALKLGEGGVDGALHGALAAPAPAWDDLLGIAIADYDEVDRWFGEEGIKARRSAEEGELDAAYSAHVIDEPGERFHTPTKAFEKIVASRREREGYRWLVDHPRRATLARAWAKSIPYDSDDALDDELHALLAAAESWNRSDVFQAIGRSRCLSFTPILLEQLSSGELGELSAVWGALFGMYEPDALAAKVSPMLAGVEWCRRAAIVNEVRAARTPARGDDLHRDIEEHQSRMRELLEPTERSALDACSAAVTSAGDASGPTLATEELDAIEILAGGPHERLAAGACFVLVRHGRHPESAILRLHSSTDEWVRLHALRAVVSVATFDRATVLRAFADPYYQCRRFAMGALSQDASTDERAQIISMATDASAPVRAACAQIIGGHKWIDGIGALCNLLNDRRDRNQGDFANEMPEYHVARDAALALQQFEAPLPESAKASILQLLEGGRRTCDDLMVHRELLGVIGRQGDPAIISVITQLLRSSWRSGDADNGSFPLRFAAAWSWVDHVLERPEDIAVAGPSVAVAAEHTDGRLAAPALLALGIAWKYALDEVRQVLGNREVDGGRALLLELGARLGGEPMPESVLAPRLPASHPGRRLIAWCWDTTSDDERWNVRLASDESLAPWLESIRAPSPINAALRAGLLRGSPRSGLLGMLSDHDFRDGEMTMGIPVISSFAFAGLE